MSTANARHQRPHGRGRHHGFSLIEILIAIIILALGLLGIGSVFPVVIREQKQSQDRIFATLAEANVRAVLRGFDELNKPIEYLPPVDQVDVDFPAVTARITGWAVLKEDWNYRYAIANNPFPNLSPELLNPPVFNFSPEGQWETFWGTWNESTAPTAANTYERTGRIVFVDQDGDVPADPEDFPLDELEARRNALVLAGATTTNLALFREDMTGGRGFIALAAVYFAAGRPSISALACLLFGLFESLQFRLQTLVNIPTQFFQMLPYIMVVVMLVIISARETSKKGEVS